MELKEAIERVETIFDQMERIAKIQKFNGNEAMKKDLEAMKTVIDISKEKLKEN